MYVVCLQFVSSEAELVEFVSEFLKHLVVIRSQAGVE